MLSFLNTASTHKGAAVFNRFAHSAGPFLVPRLELSGTEFGAGGHGGQRSRELGWLDTSGTGPGSYLQDFGGVWWISVDFDGVRLVFGGFWWIAGGCLWMLMDFGGF